MREDKQKTRVLTAYYKNVSIEIKCKSKKRLYLKPTCSSIVYKHGVYYVYLTFEKYGESVHSTKDVGKWFEIADKIDGYFAKRLRKII